ncbi:MAG: hypothetical protein QXJ85_02175 [Thermoplasmata archaeon]
MATYTYSLDESNAAPYGSDPTGIVWITVLVAPFITDTSFDP